MRRHAAAWMAATCVVLPGARSARAQSADPGERLRDPQVRAATVIIEGDIEIRAEDQGKPNPGRFGTFQPDRRWPNGVVPFSYELDPAQSGFRMAQAQAAMNRLAAFGAGTNITFVPRTNQGDYITFRDTTFNSSPVGKQGGRQYVNVINWDNIFIIGHELLHALGFWHEQSRTDRDTYVTVNLAAVCDTCCAGGSCDHNYNMEGSSSDYGPYDFDSVMHYGRCDFLWPTMFCTPMNYTLTVNPPWAAQWQTAIGQRNHFSTLDTLTASFLYALPDWRFVDANAGGGGVAASPASASGFGDGSFTNPWSTFGDGIDLTPSGGRLFVQPSTYVVTQSRYTTPIRVEAPLGGVQVLYFPFAAGAKPTAGATARR